MKSIKYNEAWVQFIYEICTRHISILLNIVFNIKLKTNLVYDFFVQAVYYIDST